MAKNFKLKIKNTQLAKAAGLDKLKAKLSGEKEEKKKKAKSKPPKTKPQGEEETLAAPVEESAPKRRVRAKTRSSFAPKEEAPQPPTPEPEPEIEAIPEPEPVEQEVKETITEAPKATEEKPSAPKPELKEAPPKNRPEKLGPTGRHIKDILPVKKAPPPKDSKATPSKTPASESDGAKKDLKKGKKVRDFKDLKPARRQQSRAFDSRDRKGLRAGEDEHWRKKRSGRGGQKTRSDESIIRPTELKVRLPITIKELAAEMKLKASEIVQKLFLQGLTYTVNQPLEDETTVEFIGGEFGCTIAIDTSEAERIQITSESISEEIHATEKSKLLFRPPVVAFMGHVDHGKTSLIDTIRKSNIVAGEAGAITQHIGAFRCKTPVGDITILDTPGHEAFSAMRARGAEVTDIVVLVVAGDEGLKDQSKEAIQHAKVAGVTIVVALNKCDKPNFNADNVFRELSEMELLPEAWGGSTITVNTSAVTSEGVPELLEMLALQAEVLELKANPKSRARGTVLESELHKGMGNVTTLLVQNGTLHPGDAMVFERHWGKVKTMRDEHGIAMPLAGPSTPVEVTGLSGLPAAGDPFIVVGSEKEARGIVEARQVGWDQKALQTRKLPTMESLLQEGVGEKKVLKLILRADVQGSAEALRTSILNIESDKVDPDVIFMGVGEISESDIQLAAASNAVVIGFHTAIESHTAPLIKELGITVKLFEVIYHAIDEVKDLMQGLLDRVEEERELGAAEVKATFKASKLGIIAGCQVSEGIVSRNHLARVVRDEEVVWKGKIASIKREKEDVKEVKKGLECGIVLDGFQEIQEGDIIQTYEIIYLTQEL